MSKRNNNRGKNPKSTKRDFEQAKFYKREPEKMDKSNIDRCIASGIGRENDPSWYNSNGALVRDAASISFYTPAGAAYVPSQMGVNGEPTRAIPGIMVLRTVTGPGVSNDQTSAVNLAAQRMYVNMRKSNSGASNYAPADMMMYCLALDSAYVCYSEMVRLYGLLNCWNQLNRYEPRYVVQALGYNYDDFRANMANYRMFVQTWIRQINAFALPISFTISKRHAWLFSNVWTDSTNAKAQMYIHAPSGYYTWEDQESDQGTMLQFHDWKSMARIPGSGIKFNELAHAMDILAQKLANSSDVAIIAGDLEKAYGSNNMFVLAELDPDYTVQPTFSEEVLMQIENSMPLTPHCRPKDMSSWNITQDVNENMIKYMPKLATVTNPGSSGDIGYAEKLMAYYTAQDAYPINMHMAEPTPDDIMVATRDRILLGTLGEGGNSYYYIKSMGCDFIESASMFSLIPGINKLEEYYVLPVVSNDTYGDYTADVSLYSASLASMFDWHPCITLIANNNSLMSYFWDFDNFTKLHNADLEKIHDAAIYNLWDIPTIPTKG